MRTYFSLSLGERMQERKNGHNATAMTPSYVRHASVKKVVRARTRCPSLASKASNKVLLAPRCGGAGHLRAKASSLSKGLLFGSDHGRFRGYRHLVDAWKVDQGREGGSKGRHR